MMNRILLYYSLLIPGFLIALFGPELLQFLFELFFILVTVALPYRRDFLRESLRKLPAFTALMLVVFAAFLGLLDFAAFLMGFSVYAALLMSVPLFLAFRMLTLPWVFLKKGLSAPIAAFKVPNEANWLVLAVLSLLAIVYYFFPFSIPFTAAPASFFLHKRLVKAGKL